jgi:hypothetical protein
MKLDDFIHESLKDIMLGVNRASGFGLDNKLGIVNPSQISFNQGQDSMIYHVDSGQLVQNVEFDIAVTVNEGETYTSGGPQSLGDITVSGHQTDNSKSNSSISRIKFSIPVLLAKR